MRCLWITRQDPRPADSGELIYSRGLLHSLAGQGGVELHVLTHRAAKDAPDSGDGIHWHLTGPPPRKRLLGILSHLPGDADRLGNPKMRGALRDILAAGSWDWIVIDQAACAWALDEISVENPAHIAYIAHNHEASLRPEVASYRGGSLPLRIALRKDAAKYARLENTLVARARLVTAITPRDAAQFQSAFPQCRISVLPPGYDAALIPASDPPTIGAATPRRVVLAGTFQWIAKRRNLEDFLNAAAAPFQAAGIEFVVVGKAHPPYFQRLSQLHPWARFHANVPSMEPFLENTRIGLIPEALGGGFKLKALDYIFRGLPLASIDAALSGLPLVPGTDTISAADPATLAAAVAKHIDSPDILNAAARSALAKCRDTFHWSDRGASLASALHDAST
ncbi:MAG: glycosyltransferase [Luteolibacter sp.]|jgi:glycosyltransferase involved in cell wall biosynthesis|nr:glycosyltransferase [Luteolibacter sp.]